MSRLRPTFRFTAMALGLAACGPTDDEPMEMDAGALNPCATVLCLPFHECRVHEPTNEPFCAPTCAEGACEAGQTCELVDVACVRAPCPPVRVCTDPADACELPAVVGPCRASIPRWFHNADSGQCERFIYGGCGGNDNNFQTLAECERACVVEVDACSLPPEQGPCRAAIPRWYHDADDGQCKRFTYGGCGGNDNNFQTKRECETACDCGPPVDPCATVRCGQYQECRVDDDSGQAFCADICEGRPCEEGQVCELQDVTCVRSPCPPVAVCVDLPPVCSLPAEVGPCDAAIPRWYHNARTRQCERFTYGGCGGNDNNFETRDDCERACHCGGPSPCDVLSCRAHQECRVHAPTHEAYCADSCDAFPCEEGERCRLRDVVCVRAPCPPIAECVGPTRGG